MNTRASVYYGWAFLIACGGGSYYFAKRSINSERQGAYQKSQQADLDARRRGQEKKATDLKIGASTGGAGGGASPGTQSGSNAVVDDTKGQGVGRSGEGGHGEQEGMKNVRAKMEERDRKKEEKGQQPKGQPEQQSQGASGGGKGSRETEQSEFESQRPFRSRKGDRFS